MKVQLPLDLIYIKTEIRKPFKDGQPEKVIGIFDTVESDERIEVQLFKDVKREKYKNYKLTLELSTYDIAGKKGFTIKEV